MISNKYALQPISLLTPLIASRRIVAFYFIFKVGMEKQLDINSHIDNSLRAYGC